MKTKIRLRWYTNSAETVFSDVAYLEVKSKEGYLGGKKRAKVPFEVPELHRDPISFGAKLNLANYLDPQVLVHGRLVPVCVIRYQRRRFIDIASGARLALDDMIEVTHVNHEMFLSSKSVLLDEAVLEVKGPNFQNIPESLLSLQNFIRARRTAFSKYGRCLSLLTIHHTGE